MRYRAGKPAEKISPSASIEHIRKSAFTGCYLSHEGELNILVWNIFKQQRADWLSVLDDFGKGTQLVLLQEAQSTPDLIDFATSHYLIADQVPAFAMPQYAYASGVMTLATAFPVYSYPLREKEPFLRSSKSALVTVYPLDERNLLMVVNVHAVNFSLGTDVYSKQLALIGEQIAHHSGPVIMAGDFNAWSRQRMCVLYRFARRVGLKEVKFENDYRRKAFGYPLDFIFYRSMRVKGATVFVTRASDHNPLRVSFTTDTILVR